MNTDAWLQQLSGTPNEQHIPLLKQACALSELASTERSPPTGPSYLQQGLAIAHHLLPLQMDAETLAAAIIYPSVHAAVLTYDVVGEHLGKPVEKLVRGVDHMDAMPALQHSTQQTQSHIENVRKMLLAMIDDIRVVVIKLAERITFLRGAKTYPEEIRKTLARETMAIYAPLSNRLGIGQMKWALEDLAFRYLDPEAYKEISKLIDQKRVDREQYIDALITEVKTLLSKLAVTPTEVTGRAKHIYSIYRKMHQKHVSFDKIYDVSAVRILVPSIEDCYNVLGTVHTHWTPIAEEFDDYIASPKENGYRSIHTAVIGPQKKHVEIQIRTFDMHKEAELGVAAHWRYKEGGQQKADYESKIAWLRQVLAWEKEIGMHENTAQKELFQDRVYIFTPNNDIIDLPQGATPLDFAYHIHSDIGHRCRGAKINGAIVPLTYTLRIGDRVEILTSKTPHPSRDWLSSKEGFLKTSRAKAKVLHWFKMQDFSKDVALGRDLFEKELKRLNLQGVHYETLAHEHHYKSPDELFAALGRGDLGVGQVLHAPVETPGKEAPPLTAPSRTKLSKVHVQGISQLLTHIAKCCQPIPGDPIVGYITQGQGVSIHRQHCTNLLENEKEHRERLLPMEWSNTATQLYAVNIHILAYHRPSLLRDISACLINEKISILAFNAQLQKDENISHATLTIEIPDLKALSKIIEKIEQLPDVIEAKRG